jgi:hypothetical protein
MVGYAGSPPYTVENTKQKSFIKAPNEEKQLSGQRSETPRFTGIFRLNISLQCTGSTLGSLCMVWNITTHLFSTR